MLALTNSERRAALIVVLLLVLGTGRDLWRARHPSEKPGAAWQGGRSGGDALPEAASPGAAGATGAREVPRGELPGRRGPEVADTSGRGASPRVDLNRASAQELDALPGLGPVLAGRIVEHRRLHGPFRRVDELLAVRGIGPRLLARLRAHLTLGQETRE